MRGLQRNWRVEFSARTLTQEHLRAVKTFLKTYDRFRWIQPGIYAADGEVEVVPTRGDFTSQGRSIREIHYSFVVQLGPNYRQPACAPARTPQANPP